MLCYNQPMAQHSPSLYENPRCTYSKVIFHIALLLGCEAGTYNNEEGQKKCKDCPSGYYCLGNTTNYVSFLCPKGHYCPPNTPNPYNKPCPPGTYNHLMGGQNISACQKCTPGYYCSGWGNIAPTDSCSPGKRYFSTL